ncbi:hypothetical protein B9W62_31485 [Streptomyces sp. CS113]|nr:hypothetical protein B9W62_31485 [Streptomyces sp. CS113]
MPRRLPFQRRPARLRSPAPAPDTRRRRPRGDPRRRRRCVPYAVVRARAVTPSRRRRAASRGAPP